MRLPCLTSLVALVILLSARSLNARPQDGPINTSEYLRILHGLKQGTLTLPARNISSTPWTYSSQGQEFGAKLKELHVSRGLPANQPKTPLLPPVLIPKDDSKPGMGFLDYLGIFTLAAGSVAVLVLACCCYLKCFKNSSTMGPL